jgi:hypothetical protein
VLAKNYQVLKPGVAGFKAAAELSEYVMGRPVIRRYQKYGKDGKATRGAFRQLLMPPS